MNYQDRFQAALEKSKELCLAVETIKFQDDLSVEEIRKITQFSIHELYKMGFTNSEKLASKCVPVHFYLNQMIESVLGIKTYITIGDRYWSEDDIYCEMSYENIRSELASPEVNNTIDAHVWLTLTDGTILDFTSEAHIDVIEQRGCFPANECFQVIQKSQPAVGYHRPFLVGFDFLYKTGCIQL